ncbi:uncharacterized protein LOC117102758 [Anneissia japonica]|uniref:uncharacterized protein LOC117102758 n=1 Tax=Anneissia japonica TaxID=1529436 RepID=UPI001425AC10|nr:uncharacterized protein LOC117102758 [Anneissia japonica]
MKTLSVIIAAFVLQTAHSAEVTLPANQVANPNHKFTFVCITNLTDSQKDENYNIKWKKNNELIAVNNTVLRYSGQISSFRFPTQHQLIIHNVSAEDRGMYTCILEFTSSHLPSTNSSTNLLIKGYLPKPFCTKPVSYETGPTTLVCSSEVSIPFVKIQLLNSTTGDTVVEVVQNTNVGIFKLEHTIDVNEIGDGQFTCRSSFANQNLLETKKCLIRYSDIIPYTTETTYGMQTTGNDKTRIITAQTGNTTAPKKEFQQPILDGSNLIITVSLCSAFLIVCIISICLLCKKKLCSTKEREKHDYAQCVPISIHSIEGVETKTSIHNTYEMKSMRNKGEVQIVLQEMYPYHGKGLRNSSNVVKRQIQRSLSMEAIEGGTQGDYTDIGPSRWYSQGILTKEFERELWQIKHATNEVNEQEDHYYASTDYYSEDNSYKPADIIVYAYTEDNPSYQFPDYPQEMNLNKSADDQYANDQHHESTDHQKKDRLPELNYQERSSDNPVETHQYESTDLEINPPNTYSDYSSLTDEAHYENLNLLGESLMCSNDYTLEDNPCYQSTDNSRDHKNS